MTYTTAVTIPAATIRVGDVLHFIADVDVARAIGRAKASGAMTVRLMQGDRVLREVTRFGPQPRGMPWPVTRLKARKRSAIRVRIGGMMAPGRVTLWPLP